MKLTKKLIAFVVTSCIIASLFCGISFLATAATVSSLLEGKKTLEPGMFDDLSTDDYNIRFIRSEKGYEGFDSVDDYFQVRENKITEVDSYGYSETFGSMLKNPHKNAYFAVDKDHSGAGASFIYKVVGDSYVATALVFQGSNISQAKRMEVCRAYGFDYSVDGNKWISIEPEFTYEHGWTAQNPGPGHQISCVRAVVLLPEDAVYYRITLPGFDKSKATDNSTDADLHCDYTVPAENDTWTGLNQVCGIGASCASELNLSELNAWADVPNDSNKAELEAFTAAMSEKAVLSPGKLDDLSDDSYIYKMLRSKELPNVGTSITEADYLRKLVAPTYGEGSTLGQMTQPYGHFLGKRVENLYTNYSQNSAWGGQSIIYRVEENSYVATMLSTSPTYNDWGLLPAHWNNYGFEVSVNGLYWQSVTPTFTNAGGWTAGTHQASFIQATVKIPAGMSYYRITLPGYSKVATGTSLRVANSWVADTGVSYAADTATNIHYGAIGMSMASNYDLSQYTKLEDVPEEKIDKTSLQKLLNRVSSIAEEGNIKDGNSKDKFESALAAAKAVNEDQDATQNQINGVIASLEKAFVSLEYNEFDEAVLSGTDKQYTERRFLRPGIYDEMLASPLVDAAGSTVTSNGFTVYRSDYSDPFILSVQDGVNNSNWTRMILNRSNMDYSAVSFMGKPIKGAYIPLNSWAASGILYRVYGDSYVSTALLVNKNLSDFSLGDLSQKYGYMISKDGENFIEITPESIVKVDSCDATDDGVVPFGWDVYKATVKIPAGYTYYRIISPGALELSKDTTWYVPNPNGYDAQIGPSIASKYDLQQYDSYEEVPDYCAVYADPEITDSNEEIAVVSEKTIGVMKYDLKVSDVKNAITVKNGVIVIKNADGSIAQDTDKVVSGMTLTLKDNSDNDYFANIMRDPLMLVLYDDLYAVEVLDPLTVANGSEKTVDGLTLPAAIKIFTGSETLEATVTWDVDGCNYNPQKTQAQSFVVKGEVRLPDGVKNTMQVSLAVSVDVTVSEPYSPSVRVREGVTKVKVDRNSLVIYYTDGMNAQELLDSLEPYGTTEYSITKYNAETDEVLAVANTDKLDTLMGLDVRYKDTDYDLAYFIFEEMAAVDSDSTDESLSGTDKDTPSTGVNSQIAVYMSLFILALCIVSIGAIRLNVKKSFKLNKR